jgi:hypothetical protein
MVQNHIKIRRTGISSGKWLLLLWTMLIALNVGANTEFPEVKKQPLKWQKEGLTIVLREDLKIPGMVWPLTLLEYPVDFSSDPVRGKEIVLIENGSNQTIPFQLSQTELVDGKIRKAVLCFLADLPSGANKEFRLIHTKNPAVSNDRAIANPVTIVPDGEEITIGNGLVRFRMATPGDYQKLVPPLLQIGNNTQWLGHSVMPSKLSFQTLKVSQLSAGPLFAHYLLDYRFKGGKSFQLKLRLVAGMEYLETEENMKGFTESDSLAWKIVWTGFEPLTRYCPNRPSAPAFKDKKGYESFTWESISGSQGNPLSERHPELPYDQKNLPDGLLPFKIAPYHNWMTWWSLPSAAFWNEKTGQTVGLFIKDFEKWSDPAYPLWGSKDNLSIHFYSKNGFYWSFPLVTGKRSTALAVYPHAKDIETSNRTNLAQVYIDYLRRWYGWISLNKTKDWVLDYGSGKPVHPVFFKSPELEATSNPREVMINLKRKVSDMADAGERSKGPNPSFSGDIYMSVPSLFENVEGRWTEPEYRQARAYYLFMTYIFMDEALMPIRNMLSGHPNFLSNIKAVLGTAVFLFPDHPQAKEMADQFEKVVALNLRYHTRPEEPSWEAKGGRWTENMALYTWGFLNGTLRTSFLLHHFYDGKNRLLQPNISLYADWLLNGLSSPYEKENSRRQILPQGAHSRTGMPTTLFYAIGNELFDYDPLLSEYICWSTSPTDRGFEAPAQRINPWDAPMKTLFTRPAGTNPHLKSEKYNGYGFNLRKNFGEPDELFVHLQQIDDGPNYRWGRAAKGGSGIIYYYASGQRYSHNGIEDVGDAPMGDTERCTNFGVKKDKSYRCIGDYRSVGRNDLTDPLYDFGFAQYASIQANGEAAPEYNSRSVLMSGNDYILIFDDVKDNSVEGRLSWFVGKEDQYPFIHQLKPGAQEVDSNMQPSKSYYHDDKGALTTKGRFYDGKGDFLTLVSHKEKINPVPDGASFRTQKPDGSVEWVLRDDHNLVFEREKMVFEGTAGLLNHSADKKYFEAALFQGTKIGIPGIVAQFSALPHYGGMSLKNTPEGFSGIIQARKETTVQFSVSQGANGLVFYLDGKASALKSTGENSYLLTVPSGKHYWQWTSTGVIPGTPQIKGSIIGATWCELEWSPVPGATTYSIQKSTNGGISWSSIAEGIQKTSYKVSGLTDGAKVHLRILATGKGGTGEPSGDYPVYPTGTKPHSPEGLLVLKTGNEVNVTWGQVLGADRYTLYQKVKGTSDFKKVYSGNERKTSIQLSQNQKIIEYSVTSANGNGESAKSSIADTDEQSILNWYPIPGEIFRRDTESAENGYDEYNHWIEQKMPVLTYPFQLQNP